MLFIPEGRRMELAKGDTAKDADEMAYLEYKKFVKVWKNNPAWSTVHGEFKTLTGWDDNRVAGFLAFTEFFATHIHEYIMTKRGVNSDIDLAKIDAWESEPK